MNNKTTKTETINTILADDHQVVLQGLEVLLGKEKDIRVVAKCINGLEVIDHLKTHQESEPVHVAVLDINMPQMNGVETAVRIKEEFPEVSVLVLTYYNEIEVIEEIFDAGASGYVLKEKNAEELVSAIREVASGRRFYSREVMNTVVDQMASPRKKKPRTTSLSDEKQEVILTRREKDVLRLIAHGHTTNNIAEELFIAPTTVETHRKNLLYKLEVSNSLALVRYAIENGLD